MNKFIKWLRDMRVSKKELLLITVTSAFLILVGLTGLYTINKSKSVVEDLYEYNLLAIMHLSLTRTHLNAAEADLLNVIISDTKEDQKKNLLDLYDRVKKWQNAYASYKLTPMTDYENENIKLMDSDVIKINKNRDIVIKYAIKGNKKQAYQYYKAYREAVIDFNLRLETLAEYNKNIAQNRYKEYEKLVKVADIIIPLSILFSLILSIPLGVLISNLIADPLTSLKNKMFLVANNNFDVEPVEIFSNDELGEAGKSFNIMTASLLSSRENELKQRQVADEVRNTFIATLTHDLKSPTMAQQKALEAILLGKLGSSLDDFSEYLRDIYNSNQEKLQLINNILIVYHYESGSHKIHPVSTNIKSIIDDSVRTMQFLAKDNETDIFQEIQVDLPEILVDKDEIRRVVINLISNAIKHTQKGTKIMVRAYRADDSVEVSISDNGKGIPEEEKHKIFQRYPTEKRKIGTGLGLYLSKQIIDSHGGRIWFESTPGVGTTFYFSLPA